MDRRLFDMVNSDRDNTNVSDTFDTDYCKPSPENMNGGILTMAFVDMQPLDYVYETDKAFSNGTLFPNIDKPFHIGGAR